MRFTRVLAAACLVATMFAPTAHAQLGLPGGSSAGSSNYDTPNAPEGGAKVIVFGDSETSGTTFPWVQDERGCLKSTTSWPSQLRQRLGMAEGEFFDASCPGSSINSAGLHFSDEVRFAEAHGALGPNTERILIQFGANDGWGNNASLLESVRNCVLDLGTDCSDRAVATGRMQDASTITAETYADRIEPVIKYLKYYAPKAHIELVGYPELLPNNGNLCLSLGPLPLSKPAPALANVFNNLQDAQAGAAQRLGLGFRDLRGATAGHSSCSADPWVVGIGDLRADFVAAPLHPSVRGNAVAADVLAR